MNWLTWFWLWSSSNQISEKHLLLYQFYLDFLLISSLNLGLKYVHVDEIQIGFGWTAIEESFVFTSFYRTFVVECTWTWKWCRWNGRLNLGPIFAFIIFTRSLKQTLTGGTDTHKKLFWSILLLKNHCRIVQLLFHSVPFEGRIFEGTRENMKNKNRTLAPLAAMSQWQAKTQIFALQIQL